MYSSVIVSAVFGWLQSMQNNMSLATEKWETEGEFGSCTQPISAEAYDKAVRGLLGSVYQRDYMGIPSGKNGTTSLHFIKKAIHAMQWKYFDWKDTPWRSCTDFLRLIGEPRSRSHKTRRCDVTSSNQFNNASLKFLLDVTALITRRTYTQEALVMCDVVDRVFLWWF